MLPRVVRQCHAAIEYGTGASMSLYSMILNSSERSIGNKPLCPRGITSTSGVEVVSAYLCMLSLRRVHMAHNRSASGQTKLK